MLKYWNNVSNNNPTKIVIKIIKYHRDQSCFVLVHMSHSVKNETHPQTYLASDAAPHRHPNTGPSAPRRVSPLAHGSDMDQLLCEWLRATAELTSTAVSNTIINHIGVNQLPVFEQLAFSSFCSFLSNWVAWHGAVLHRDPKLAWLKLGCYVCDAVKNWGKEKKHITEPCYVTVSRIPISSLVAASLWQSYLQAG